MQIVNDGGSGLQNTASTTDQKSNSIQISLVDPAQQNGVSKRTKRL